jgi:hypothetical protein
VGHRRRIVHVLEDIRRSADAGIRSVLVTDLGVLTVAAKMREAGELPVDLQFKVSVQMGLANPAAARLAEQAGANTYNVPADLSLAQLAAIRAAMDIPLDIYVEADDLGGFVRFRDRRDRRVAAPVYLKFGLRNAPDIYPSGTHLTPTAVALVRERVRRAEIGLELRSAATHPMRSGPLPAADLAVPRSTRELV